MTSSALFRDHIFRANGAIPSLRSLGKPAAAFPGRVATDQDMVVAVDRQVTKLALPLDSVSTSMTIADPSQIATWSLLSIDNEIVQIIGPVSGNVVPITRAFDGTTAATHLAGAPVMGFVDAYHHNRLVAEVEAIEQALGVNLSHVPSTLFIFSTPYDFPAQTPGGSLIAGSNVIALSPVPQGVNGTDKNHYLYISGGTGTPESALITGGTAVAGAASGTVIVTCANTHSGAWTIQSSTSGIREAMCAYPNQLILVPAGSYFCDNLIIDSPNSLAGFGFGQTTLKPRTGGASAVVFVNPTTTLFGVTLAGFTIEMAGFSSQTGLLINNMERALVRDLIIRNGATGIHVQTSSGQCSFINIKMRDQNTTSFQVDGDTSAEIVYENIDIMQDGLGDSTTTTNGFRISRTTQGDIGGHYMNNVRVTKVGGTVTNGFVFTSTASGAQIVLFMTNCVSDSAVNPMILTNMSVGYITGGWFWGTNAIQLNNLSAFSFSNNNMGTGADIFLFATGGGEMRFSNNRLVAASGHYAFNIPAASGYTDLILDNTNRILGGTLTNSRPNLAAAAASASANPLLGLTILTSTSGTAEFWFQDAATGNNRSIRNNNGILEFMNNAHTSAVTQLLDDGSVRLGGVHILTGSGAPAVAGWIGDLYLNTAGGAGTTLYVKESGAGTTTGWVGK